MGEIASLAKISRPILKDAYLRLGLFDVLDQARKQPLVWVSGPPGCGKTTLVTSYVEARDLPCLWYEIDEGDADPATFFYYLSLAAKKAAPRRRKPLPLLTPEYLPGLPTFTLRYFENLYSRLKVPSFLVFDNYQEVVPESPFHEVMRQGLSNIPQGVNVIVLSRSEPPPTLMRMRANNLMAELAWDELRLTSEESEGIVRLQTGETLSKGTIRHLHTATDGWLAGLMLMLKTAQREKVDPRDLGTVPLEQIFDYFAGEIFDRIDIEAQEFLLKTAFLRKMTASMAEELTGFDFASRILSRLHRNHCFTLRHLHSPPTYEYHPLFREFLLARANEEFSPEALADAGRRAAMVLEKAGHIEAAIEILADFGRLDAAVPLILKHAPGMLAQGRNRPLAEWLAALPREMVENMPWLVYWTGASHFPFNLSQSRYYFEKAFKEFKDQDDTAGAFLAWSGVVDSIIYGMENFVQLDQWIQELDTFMRDCPAFPSPEIEARVASSMFTALVFRQPQHPDIKAWAELVLSLPEEQTPISTRMMTLSHLFNLHARLGNVKRVDVYFEMLNQLSRSKNAPPFSLITARLTEAYYFHMYGFYAKGLEAASEGLEISRTTGVHLLDQILLGGQANIALDANDLQLARRTLEEMASPHHRPLPYEKALYHFLKSREALICRDFRLASHHADLALRLVDDAGAPYNMAVVRLLKAQAMHELGKHGEAEEHLTNALRIARETNSKMLEFNASMIQAQFALDQGDEASGLNSLRKALAMGREPRFFNTIHDQPAATAKLCAKALEAGIEVDYVQAIIRKRKLIPDTPPVHVEYWPWAVQIFTLGRFELLVDGKPFRFRRKAQKRPLAMLKALVSFGSQSVDSSQLTDVLWPEADGDRAQQTFDTTLHRLRQLLGHDKALNLLEGKLTLDPRYCWVDSMAFERILEQADNALVEANGERAIPLFEKAIALYQGPFLGEEADQPWAISYSERLRSRFLQSIKKLGSCLEEIGDLNKAVDCFQRAIEVDDLAEVFYQRLMHCLKKLGRRADALAVYQRCRKTLGVCLGLEPTPETKAIYKSLLSE